MKWVLAASGFEALLTLLLFLVIAALSSRFRKKQMEEEEPESWSPPRPPTRSPGPPRRAPGQPGGAPAPKPLSWEEELRRLLAGEPAQPPPPPVIVSPVAPLRPAAAPPPIPRPQPAAEGVGRKHAEELAGLKSSAAAYQRASHLDAEVTEHLRRVQERIASHQTAPQPKRLLPELALARAWLRDRESLRSAFVASVILGPPRALED